jgi:hypothetical protein
MFRRRARRKGGHDEDDSDSHVSHTSGGYTQGRPSMGIAMNKKKMRRMFTTPSMKFEEKFDDDSDAPALEGTLARIGRKLNPIKLRRGRKKTGTEPSAMDNISVGNYSSDGGASFDGSNDGGDKFGGRMKRLNSYDDNVPRSVTFGDEPAETDDYGYGDVESSAPAVKNITAPTTHASGERARYSMALGVKQKKKKFRVKPHHCFANPVQMTEEQIYADSLAPTKRYERLKSYLDAPLKKIAREKVSMPVKQVYGDPEEDGRIGSFRVEVLGAISLPRQKPDVIVYVVCGDSAFATDVLSGYRSPMWPSLSRRGAIFPVHHAYARAYIGVFDCKARANKDQDVFCGRVVIDLATMRPNTEYDVTFPLRASSYIYDRRPRGVLRIRFSLHWFCEKAAVLSYFSSPKSLVKTSPLVAGQPTIPCADPKTFRNVAVTVHGADFPGVYSRNAFRAIMREFNLYRINIVYLIKSIAVDAVLYERPLISLYLFVAGMYCIYCNSMSLVPPFFITFILILYFQNYLHYVEENTYNLGFKPVTMFEIAKGLLFRGEAHESFAEMGYQLQAIMIQKKTKKRDEMGREEKDSDPADHREFPFGERDAYPKFGVESALAPSTKKGSGLCPRCVVRTL